MGNDELEVNVCGGQNRFGVGILLGDWDVHWGVRDFDPWPNELTREACLLLGFVEYSNLPSRSHSLRCQSGVDMRQPVPRMPS